MKAKYPPIKDDPCYLESLNPDREYFFDEDGALMKLLEDDICFFIGAKDNNGKEMISVVVNCNDLFYWACSDAEDFSYWDDIEDLYRAHVLIPKWGSVVWVCKHRNLQPQVPVKKDMIKDGAWTDELEALPEPNPS